jgi:hypothetical protein
LAKYFTGPNHISAEGLPGVSYTAVVEPSGIGTLCNDVEDETFSQGDAAGSGDENALYLAVCYCGNFSGPGYQGTQEPTDAQMITAHQIWATCKDLWGWKNNQLFGHYHFGKPACPGYTLTNLIESVNADKDWADPKYDLEEIDGRQGALKELGYYEGEIGGAWSTECRYALTQFQTKAGLTPDGVWGPKTNAAVLAALG